MPSERTLPSPPPHVPPELVRAFDPVNEEGMTTRPHEALSKLQQECRIFYNTAADERLGSGAWVPTRAEDIREILQRHDLFSAKGAGGFAELIGEDWDLIPVEKDPPEHTEYRHLLNPRFMPGAVALLEDRIREWAIELIERVRVQKHCDFVTDFAQPFPIFIFMELMGLPKDRFNEFLDWADQLLHGSDLETRAKGCRSIATYLRELIEERRNHPQDDIVTYLTNAEVFGRKMTRDELLGTCFLLFGGGIDTVAASLGFHFRHLAEHPELQAELREKPELIRNTTEEFLRAFSIVTSTRRVVQDVEFAGVQMKKGDWVLIISPLVSLDPRLFDDPLTVDIHRAATRHGAFSSGVHHCLGAHLARREISIAIGEWTQRVPDFRIDPAKEVIGHGGNLLGLDHLPLVWS